MNRVSRDRGRGLRGCAALFVLASLTVLAACGTSPFPSNWSGYCAGNGHFTSVSASWVEPVVYASGASSASTSFWVGLDGDQDTFVEQIGTEADTTGQAVFHGAWYEMFPAAPASIDMTIQPGDLMHATVSRDGPGKFTLTLINETTGASFATTQSASKPPASSAEVIVEATSSSLPEFDSIRFTGCLVDGRPIGDFGPASLDIVDHHGQAQATASRIGEAGTSFAVSQSVVGVASHQRDVWIASGAPSAGETCRIAAQGD